MLIGCGVGVLVGVIVGVVVALGLDVLLGDGVALRLWVWLGGTTVAGGVAVDVSPMTVFPPVLQPPAMMDSSDNSNNPANTLIESLRLPVNNVIIDD
jgi:hypothetical protein